VSAAPEVLATSFVAMFAAHQFGDYWLQTPHQAMTKGGAGWTARWACARHVLVLALAKLVALFAAFEVTGSPIRPGWWFAALVVDGLSHYWADRRSTLRRLAAWIGDDKLAFFELGTPREGHDDRPCLGTGAAHLDQSWHIVWLFVTALIIAGGVR